MKAFTITFFLFSFIAVQVSSFAVAKDFVRYNISLQFPDPKQSYYIDLLKLVLETTKEEFGEYALVPIVIEMSQGRTSIMVEKNEIDVTWRMTSAELEDRLQAVYVPLLKGLMGHRIFIIRQDDQARFSQVSTIEQLRKLVAGQGHDWPDVDILRANNFPVSLGGAYDLLFMLEKERFDYFPRAVHEPWAEIEGNSKFVVEQHIMLKYPAPLFFFVNKENKQLYERLTKGLKTVIENGSFEILFTQHEITKDLFINANLHQRIVFELENPLLTKKTAHAMKNYVNSK